ncbi:JAB domain-containing protein [Luteolibacter sp. LG18]|uniref:JAB domain-containing protein n=1 Tax=Luteolibacter sp. LG18 TaxID=2819286 RepID=UPI002B2C8DB7|nr:hypothetical protein llg_22850 [Luteolibacter sp. LG18]BCU79596.1 hypothetical protein llg_43110 [Luteolibacter sp. LG18]
MNPARDSIGQFRVARVREDTPGPVRKLDHPEAVVAAWHDEIASAPWFDPAKEHVVVFVLDTRMHLVGWNLVTIGLLNESLFHPREVFRPVIVAAGYGFVVVHNHPSGDPSPSGADERETRRLREAAELLHLAFHDHVIIGRDAHHSFRGSGAL